MLPCVVLAGGLGTRMRPQTERLPKALIPVLGRPFAEIQLEWLASQSATEILYSIGYLGDMVRAALGDGSRWGVRITYVDEGGDLRGTAGALRLALDAGKLPDAFFVLNGDSYLRVKLAAVETAWRMAGVPTLMTIFRNLGRWDRSNVALRPNGLVLYQKQASQDQTFLWIDYGLSVITCATIAEALPRGGHGDLADIVHVLSRSGQVAGFKVSQRFYEVGSPEGHRQLEVFLTRTMRGRGSRGPHRQ